LGGGQREHGDLISVIAKIRGVERQTDIEKIDYKAKKLGSYTDRWTNTEEYKVRQQVSSYASVYSFKIRKVC
jgi:hypothetical protein